MLFRSLSPVPFRAPPPPTPAPPVPPAGACDGAAGARPRRGAAGAAMARQRPIIPILLKCKMFILLDLGKMRDYFGPGTADLRPNWRYSYNSDAAVFVTATAHYGAPGSAAGGTAGSSGAGNGGGLGAV